MPIENAPIRFRFNAKSIHLTFKSHIDHKTVLEMLKSKGDVKWYSIVHELGHTDSTDVDAVAYDHTHAACEWKKKLDAKSPRYFDIADIHPHIQKINGQAHAILLYEDYHRKSPVLLTQSEGSPRAHSASEEGIKSAMSLFDACKALDIEPKTVGDILLIRNDKRRRDPYTHSFTGTVWTLPTPDYFRCLYVYGPSGTGKTQWALHLFENPLMVRHVDQLRDFDAAINDGIVFDDMNFNLWSRETIIHLTDWDEESAIQCR